MYRHSTVEKRRLSIGGKCRAENIIFKCIVSTSVHLEKAYLATAEENFKRRYYSHINFFKNKTQKNKTTLAMYVWKLKQKHNILPLKWCIVKLYHLILILPKASCYAYTISLKFWPTQTKMNYWTQKIRNSF